MSIRMDETISQPRFRDSYDLAMDESRKALDLFFKIGMKDIEGKRGRTFTAQFKEKVWNAWSSKTLAALREQGEAWYAEKEIHRSGDIQGVYWVSGPAPSKSLDEYLGDKLKSRTSQWLKALADTVKKEQSSRILIKNRFSISA